MEEVALDPGVFDNSSSERIVAFGLFPEGKKAFEHSHKIKYFLINDGFLRGEKTVPSCINENNVEVEMKNRRWKMFRG